MKPGDLGHGQGLTVTMLPSFPATIKDWEPSRMQV